MLRRSGTQRNGKNSQEAIWVVDLSSGRVFASGQEVKLSGTVWHALEFLRNAGRVIPAAALAARARGFQRFTSRLYPRPRKLRMTRGDWVLSPSFFRSRRTHILIVELST